MVAEVEGATASLDAGVRVCRGDTDRTEKATDAGQGAVDRRYDGAAVWSCKVARPNSPLVLLARV